MVKRGIGFVLIGLGCGGFAGEADAYRTAGDLPEFEDTERVRWATDVIHYRRTQWLPPGLVPSAVDDATALGFSAWSDLACPTVTFVNDGTTSGSASLGDGNVTVQWISHDWVVLGFDPSAAASTDILYERGAGNQWRITDADIFLNAEWFDWSVDGIKGEARDVQAVITHEVGHVLGLLHPCEPGGLDGAPECGPEFSALTMYPDYFLDQRTLESDDEAGACFLYEPAECLATGCPAGLICIPEGCAAPCDETICAVGERCGPAGCTSEICSPGSCERGCDATCNTPGGEDGDPCEADFECYSGHCSEQRYCTPLCGQDSSCPEGFLCNPSTGPPECTPQDGVLGDPCSSGNDCLSDLCLIENDLPKMCTRPCGGFARSCPAAFFCSVVDGVDVCVPYSPSGCEASAAAQSAGASRVLLLFAVVVSVIAIRTKRGGRA